MSNKECPFCGSSETYVAESFEFPVPYRACINCGATGPKEDAPSDVDWNTRTINKGAFDLACWELSDWLHWCNDHEEEPEPWSGVMNALNALGIKVKEE